MNDKLASDCKTWWQIGDIKKGDHINVTTYNYSIYIYFIKNEKGKLHRKISKNWLSPSGILC
ncbi:MAG: hypothetical protein ABSC54_05425 [Smithellaceae bacterium]|jgi:hypothetical protein